MRPRRIRRRTQQRRSKIRRVSSQTRRIRTRKRRTRIARIRRATGTRRHHRWRITTPFHRPTTALRNELAPCTELAPTPLRTEPHADARALRRDNGRTLVCARDDLHRPVRDADRIPHADEDAAQDADAADEELEEGGGALVNGDCERVEVEFEEDAWRGVV